MTVKINRKFSWQPWLGILILAVAWWQWLMPLPGGLMIPLATLLLPGATLIVLLGAREKLPQYSWPLAIALLLLCAGLLGTPRSGLGGSLKELVQYAEIMVLSACLFGVMARAGYLRQLNAGIACLHIMLLMVYLLAPELTGLSNIKFSVLTIVSLPFFLHALRPARAGFAGLAVLAETLVVSRQFEHGGLILVWAVLLLWSGLRRPLAAPGLRFSGLPRLVPTAGVMTLALWTFLPLPRLPATANGADNGETPPTPWSVLNLHYRDSDHLQRFYIEAKAARLAPRHRPFGGGPGHYLDTINQLRLELSDTPHPDDQKVMRDGNCQYLLTLVDCGLPAALALPLLLLFAMCRAGRGRGRERHREECRDWSERELRQPLGDALLGFLLAGLFAVTLSGGVGIWLGGFLGMALMGWPERQQPGSGVLRHTPWLLLGFGGLLILGATLALAKGQEAEQTSRSNRVAAQQLEKWWPSRRETIPIILRPDPLTATANDAMLHLEAEAYRELVPPFTLIGDLDASGQLALEIPLGAGKATGQAIFELDIPVAGSYIITARVKWEDGCSNSIGFKLREQQAMVSSDTYNAWHSLSTRREFHLPAGPCQLTLVNLEDGVQIDFMELHLRQ